MVQVKVKMISTQTHVVVLMPESDLLSGIEQKMNTHSSSVLHLRNSTILGKYKREREIAYFGFEIENHCFFKKA